MIHGLVTMPVGKHRGQRLDRLPSSYLLWSAATLHRNYPRLVGSILEVLRDRLADLPSVQRELDAEPSAFVRGVAKQHKAAEERQMLELLWDRETVDRILEARD